MVWKGDFFLWVGCLVLVGDDEVFFWNWALGLEEERRSMMGWGNLAMEARAAAIGTDL